MYKPILIFIFLFQLFTAHTQDIIELNECVISNGKLMEVKALYDRSSGRKYIVVNGARKNFDEVYPPDGKDYAASASWYINNEKIRVMGNDYVKYGLPRVLGINEISWVSVFKGINVYVEAGSSGTPDIIYIPVRSGCEYQSYQKVLPECGVVTISTNVKQVTAGSTVVCTAGLSGAKGKMNYLWETNGVIISGEESAKATISSKGVKEELWIELYVYDEDETCESMKYVVIPVK